MARAKVLPEITHQDLALLSEQSQPFDREGWIFELKMDGFRCLAIHSARKVTMLTRNGNDIADRFPELTAELSTLSDLVLDGELVVVDDQGRPQFERLRNRAVKRAAAAVRAASIADPAVLFVFDLLWLDGRDLRAEPLLKRKVALRSALGKTKRVRILDHVGERGERLYQAAVDLELEGIVAKRADSAYPVGRTRDWIKIKTGAGRATQAARGEAWNK